MSSWSSSVMGEGNPDERLQPRHRWRASERLASIVRKLCDASVGADRGPGSPRRAEVDATWAPLQCERLLSSPGFHTLPRERPRSRTRRASTVPRSSRGGGRSEPAARRDAGRGSRRASLRRRNRPRHVVQVDRDALDGPIPPEVLALPGRSWPQKHGQRVRWIGDRFDPDLQPAGRCGLSKKLTFRGTVKMLRHG